MIASRCKFGRDQNGSISPFFALSIVPLLIAAGAATDYARYVNVKTELEAALDGAALAAAQSTLGSDAARENVGKAYFSANMAGSAVEGAEADVVISNGGVRASAAVQMPTSFMRLAGVNAMELQAAAEANLPTAGNAELVLVLDYSGSMNSHQKYQRMATAATDMLTSLEGAAGDINFKVGLVPFSAMVRTTMSAAYVNQNAAGPVWTGCTQDRASPYNVTVSTPTADPDSKWGYQDNNGENRGSYGCNAYASKDLDIMPLASDIDAVREQLDDMRPLGNTNIALGAEFGWNLLDPALPFDEGKPYSDSTNKKFLVLLTDGVQTSREFGENNSRSVGNAQQNLLALCSGMRNANITVFAIAYDVTDPDVTELLRTCAPGRYYEPAVGADNLNAVFSEITSQITDEVVRLTK